MKRYIPIWAALLMSFSAQAEVSDEEINVVIFAPKAGQETVDERLPSCNNQKMINAVAAHIREYQEGNPSNSIVGRRKQKLIVKNLREFKEVPIATFDRKSNYSVGRELVMAKINYRLEENNMRLCRNMGSDIYLLMYPEGSGARVQIINFVPVTGDSNEFSIYYENPQGSKDEQQQSDEEKLSSSMSENVSEQQAEISQTQAEETLSSSEKKTEQPKPVEAQPQTARETTSEK